MGLPQNIDPNAPGNTFDAGSDLPFPGTWYRQGVEDAMNGLFGRSLNPPFDVMQDQYDAGFRDGTYQRSLLNRSTI
jgi:hypothetical protein